MDVDPRLHTMDLLLRAGRYAEGWPLMELRPPLLTHAARRFPFPQWQGEPLAGKRLLVCREQGFGDAIMMARFLPHLAPADVTFICAEPLARLFSRLPATIQAQPDPRTWAVDPHDYWVSLMSLPHRLGVTLENLPAAPYLGGAGARRGQIGVFWRGNLRIHPERSLSEDLAAQLLALPGAISLQPEDTGAADFQETADTIAGLDLVISTDSAVAHLAGAMGKPLLLMLPHAADWRWLEGRGDSPWYPSAQILRQLAPGDWSPVIEAVLRRCAEAVAL